MSYSISNSLALLATVLQRLGSLLQERRHGTTSLIAQLQSAHTHIFFHDPMTAGSEAPSSVHTGLHCKRSSRIWPNRSRKMRRGKATARAHSPIAKPEADARHKARHNRSRGRKTVTGVLIGNLLSRLYESSHLGSRQRDLCESMRHERRRDLCVPYLDPKSTRAHCEW